MPVYELDMEADNLNKLNFTTHGTWTQPIATTNGGTQTYRFFADNTGIWMLVGRWNANAMSNILGTWSSVSPLATSLAQDGQTAFSADWGDAFASECRFIGASDFSDHIGTRNIDFIHIIPSNRKWKAFMTSGNSSGMAAIHGNAKYGWICDGAYDGRGRWYNPDYIYHRMSDGVGATNLTITSAAFTGAVSSGFHWNTHSDAKVTVSKGNAYSGQDTTYSAGFGQDDNTAAFNDFGTGTEGNNMGGGSTWSTAVFMMIKLSHWGVSGHRGGIS